MNQKIRPHILITNDDGIQAPGIRHLFNALSEFADTTIVAPATQQSASGVSITLRNPLQISQAFFWPDHTNAWHVDGTPADCVKMALNVVLKKPPTLIVSGINQGSNAGRNIFYSGTIGGVIEGVLHDIPGVAFSCIDFENPPFSRTEPYVTKIVKYLIAHPLPKGSFFNVNFPSKSHTEIKGAKLVRQGKEFWAENPDKRSHPYGHSYYWLGMRLAEFEEHEESEITWLRKGYMTCVPVAIEELTDHYQLKTRKEHFEGLFATKMHSTDDFV